MRYEVAHPTGAGWPAANAARLAKAAGHLHHLARPYLYEALGQPVLIQTVREFPLEVSLEELARSVAGDALRRALRSSGADAPALAAHATERNAPGWQTVRNLALVDLAEDAARELERIRLPRPSSTRWDG